jgi:segregation and condensation protein B
LYVLTEPAHDVVPDDEPEWSGEELEAAYLRALEALESIESVAVATAEELAPGAMTIPETLAEPATSPAAAITSVSSTAEPEPYPQSADQIVEACLFVGGESLTAAKLASVLRGNTSPDDVEQAISRLNDRYRNELRPYEIRWDSGGYRYGLHPDYERIRDKVYGQGPKEVRLSQDALEVLALVAYHQPVTETVISELGRPNSGGTLRLLLRRDLIVVDRDPAQPKEVRYRTTDRFLSLFGVKSLDDLPRPDDLMYK